MISIADASSFAKNKILLSPSTILLVADPFLTARTQSIKSLGFDVHSVAGFIYPKMLKKELPRQYGDRVADRQIDYIRTHLPDDENAESKQIMQRIMGIVTTVYCGRSLIGQYGENNAELRSIIQKLSGRRHRVLTTIVLQCGLKQYRKQVETMVAWKCLSSSEIDHFMAINHQQQMIGGYLPLTYEGERFIKSINGMPSNLMGLPMLTVNNLLNGSR